MPTRRAAGRQPAGDGIAPFGVARRRAGTGPLAVKPEPGRIPNVRRLCIALAAAITFQLFYLGAQPFAAGLIPAWWDKLAHLAVFATLTALLWIGTAGRMPLAVIATAIAIGAFDELHQASLPGRRADAIDFLTDAGAAIGTAFLILWFYARRKTANQ